MDDHWIPIIGTLVLGVCSLATLIVRAVQARRTLEVMLRSLPLEAGDIDIEISDERGSGIRLTFAATQSREGGPDGV